MWGTDNSRAEAVPQAVGVAMQRPRGRTMLEKQEGDLCVWSRMSKGEEEEGKEGRGREVRQGLVG